MSALLEQIASAGSAILSFAWMPVLIWTLVVILVLSLIQVFSRLHIQYHYHVRLSLLLALPAGLVIAFLVQTIGSMMSSPDTALQFIVVQPPIEISATEGQNDPSFLFSFWEGMVLGGMGIGSLFLFCRHIFQYVQLRKLTRSIDLTPIHHLDSASVQNQTLALQTRKKIRVAFMNTKIVPVTYGAGNPVILLPESLSKDHEKLNLVLRHELTHILNRDFHTHLCMVGIRNLFWIHPLVHILYRQLVDYREMRCDNQVLSDHSVSRKKYASVLLELLPMPNLDRQLSVNMAQESSNLKKRINMINHKTIRNIPLRTSITAFFAVFMATVLVMACTDMQQNNVFDEEELDLMTDFDESGNRGYHEITIFMGDEDQDDRHRETLSQLDENGAGHIMSMSVLKGQDAVEEYGPRGEHGVIVIHTQPDPDSYNTVLQALGMEPIDTSELESFESEDAFTVVEQMPELIGGLVPLQASIQYPEMARRAGIEGRVYVQFVVNEEGDVENPRVIRGIGGGCDEEALRVVREAKFEPGMQRGEPVRVAYSLPFVFRLGEGASAEEPEVEGQSMRLDNLDISDNQISGVVLDDESGQPLSGANIVLIGSNTGIITSSKTDGSFTLSLSSDGETDDSEEIVISHVGYQSISRSI